MWKKIDKVLTGFENTVLVFGVLSASIILFLNVVLRYVFNSGWSWAEEYARYAIIWVTFAGCGVAVRQNAHMRVTALYEVVKPGVRKILEIITDVVFLCFALFLLVFGAKLTYNNILTGQVSTAMQVPKWIIYICVPIGSALTIIRLIENMIKIVKTPAEKLGAIEETDPEVAG